MKKYVLGLLLIIAVVFVSGCIGSSNDTAGTVEQGGVSLNIPANWSKASSQSSDVLIAVADNKSVGANGIADISVIVQKKEANGSLKDIYNNTYATFLKNSSYKMVSEGNASLGEHPAMEAIYTVDSANGTIQHRAIWIAVNGNIYVILCTAPQSKFEAESNNFDFIVNSFKLTSK
ncbi:MAG: PsbP-related protein [Methanobacteriaceae archaeon]